jgi:hypothetical protein
MSNPTRVNMPECAVSSRYFGHRNISPRVQRQADTIPVPRRFSVGVFQTGRSPGFRIVADAFPQPMNQAAVAYRSVERLGLKDEFDEPLRLQNLATDYSGGTAADLHRTSLLRSGGLSAAESPVHTIFCCVDLRIAQDVVFVNGGFTMKKG